MYLPFFSQKVWVQHVRDVWDSGYSLPLGSSTSDLQKGKHFIQLIAGKINIIFSQFQNSCLLKYFNKLMP